MTLDDLVRKILVETDSEPTIMFRKNGKVYTTAYNVHNMNIENNIKILIQEYQKQ